MDEETTTPAAPAEGVEETQPAAVAPVEAEQTPVVATEEQTEEAPAEPSEDEQLKAWADKKGLELDSDNAKKAAKMAQNAEKLMHQKTQQASELEKSVTTQSDAEAAQVAEATGQDPELLQRLQRVEVKEAVRDFWNQDGIDRSFEPAMIELLKTKPYLAGDLDSLYASAVFKSGGVAAVKSQGKREALTDLAHKQQAVSPTGSATTNGTPRKKSFGDMSITEMEKELGFAKRQ